MAHAISSSSDTVNLTLLGDGSVGKSSIIRAFRVDGFSRIYEQVYTYYFLRYLSMCYISVLRRLWAVTFLRKK